MRREQKDHRMDLYWLRKNTTWWETWNQKNIKRRVEQVYAWI